MALGIVLAACGSQNGSGFAGAGGPAGGDQPDAETGGGSDEAGGGGFASDDGGGGGSIIGTSDGGLRGSKCENLQCNVVSCAAQGKPETTLTGTIRDPAGNLPLYNVYVYVPNATPDPITPGNPTCSPCEAPASGNPIVGTTTDINGQFTLAQGTGTWGVPSGSNIPLVIQVGKWRRQVVIPDVQPCTTVDLDTVLGPDQMRLPKMSSEGDMPLIALTTAGFDAFECFLRVVGVDDSEFVAPGSTTGHVQVYTGAYNSKNTPAATIAGGNTVQQTFQWWNSSANLLKYDFVLNGCDGVEAGSRGTGYTAMQEYLDGGGRAFGTDFFVDWFSPPKAPSVDSMVADWPGWNNATKYDSYYIDTSFPKGQAFGQWLVANQVTEASGTGDLPISLTDTWPDVNDSGPAKYPGSTRWIYNAENPGDSDYSTSYISFNTPIGNAPAQQCGRAVFSGVHVFAPDQPSNRQLTFPAECGNEQGQASAYLVNQQALEFLFFDLSSCVQDETQPPMQPPPVQ